MRAYMTGFLSWKELLMRLNFSGYIVLWLTHIVCFLDVPVNLCTEEKVWRWQGGCGSCTLHEEKGIPWAHESQAALKEGGIWGIWGEGCGRDTFCYQQQLLSYLLYSLSSSGTKKLDSLGRLTP